MSKFSVKTGNVKREVDSLKGISLQLKDSREEVHSIASSVAISGAAYSIIKKSLNDAVDNLDELKRNTESMKSGLSDIVKLYATTEAKMTATKVKLRAIGTAGKSADHAGASTSASASTSAADGSVSTSGKYGDAEASGSVFSADASASAQAHAGDGDYSASGQAGASASVVKGNASASNAYGEASASGSVLAASAAIAGSAGVQYENGKVSGGVEASASAKAAVANAEAEAKAGTDDINAHGSAEGSVLGAKAEAEAGATANKNGSSSVKAKVDAEAYVAKGEVSGGFTIFGVDVDLEVEGMVGVQAEAGAEVSSTGISFDVGLGPIGGEVKIDWSDFELPGINWLWK